MGRQEGLGLRLYRASGRSVAERLGVETIDLYLSHWPTIRFARRRSAPIGADRQGQDSLVRRVEFSARNSRRRSKPRARKTCRATRSCSQSTISTTAAPSRAACATSASPRRSASSPITASQRVPRRQVPHARRSRPEPARRGVRGYLNPRGLRIVDALAAVRFRAMAPSRPKWRSRG